MWYHFLPLMLLIAYHAMHTRFPSQVVLERGLPVNVSLQWNPKVYQFMEGISEVGIEYLTIQMK